MQTIGSNHKKWRLCRFCHKWVFDYPLGVDQMCDQCWVALVNHDHNKRGALEAAEYLERDYAVVMF